MATGKVTVVNQSSQSHMLDDGTQIGAARTPEARRDGVTLSESDRRRLVDTGYITVIEPRDEAVTNAGPAAKSEGRVK